MKKLLLSLIAIMILAQSSQADIAGDKAKHAMVGMLIYTGCFFVKGIGESMKYDMNFLTMRTCLVPVIVAGVGKEWYDSQHDGYTAEWEDVAATIAIPLTLDFVLYEW